MGSTATDLPNGDHIVFRDPAKLKERDRRKVKNAILMLDDSTVKNLSKADEAGAEITAEMFTKHDLSIMDELNDVAIVALIEHWKRPNPANPEGPEVDIAATVESLLDLEGPDYDAINAAATPLIERLNASFAPTAPGTESPTEPASA